MVLVGVVWCVFDWGGIVSCFVSCGWRWFCCCCSCVSWWIWLIWRFFCCWLMLVEVCGEGVWWVWFLFCCYVGCCFGRGSCGWLGCFFWGRDFVVSVVGWRLCWGFFDDCEKVLVGVGFFSVVVVWVCGYVVGVGDWCLMCCCWLVGRSWLLFWVYWWSFCVCI